MVFQRPWFPRRRPSQHLGELNFDPQRVGAILFIPNAIHRRLSLRFPVVPPDIRGQTPAHTVLKHHRAKPRRTPVEGTGRAAQSNLGIVANRGKDFPKWTRIFELFQQVPVSQGQLARGATTRPYVERDGENVAGLGGSDSGAATHSMRGDPGSPRASHRGSRVTRAVARIEKASCLGDATVFSS